MSDYRRNFIPGGTYFFTIVTHERRPILTTDLGRACLRRVLSDEKKKRQFELVASVLLPDHLHAVWTLPHGDSDFSMRWSRIKSNFTRIYLQEGGVDGISNVSRQRHFERAIWQRRFWEHTCRDPDDLKRCVDYCHGNPVKHGLVSNVIEYPWSSFHRYVREGEYEPGWGGGSTFPGHIEAFWE
jgi:putative transposase